MSLLGAIAITLTSVIGNIAASANWGISSGSSPQTSEIRTLTVPIGNPGTLKWNVTLNEGTLEYKKNAGAFTAVVHDATLAVASGDALSFRYSGSVATGAGLEVLDNTTAASVGTWTASIL